MKKFSIISENNSNEKYFHVSAEIKLSFPSDSEGEAGYKADSILGGIKEQTEFMIKNIEELRKEDYDKLFESIESPSWIENGGYMERTFEFDGFKESIEFVNKVAKLSEEISHHPKIYIDFNQVKLLLKTNKMNKITDMDHKMAKKIDDIFNI